MTNPQAELRRQLMNALYHDDFSTVDNLLKQGVNVNLPYNHNGWTPFMWVCKEHCDPEIIGKFLICGGKVDKANNHGKTPLHIMAEHRSSFVPSLLCVTLTDFAKIVCWPLVVLLVLNDEVKL